MNLIMKAQNEVMKVSRNKKMLHFYSLFKEGESVLDVGVESEAKQLTAGNYFLKNYRYNPETYTGLGIEDLTNMKHLYPKKRFAHYSGGKFPFPDKKFDWVFSNAVIEHVGDDEAQLLFINEMMRVASNVFFTTPNKYFPVESHTRAFFLHWHDELFRRWYEKNQPWVIDYGMYLFSFHRLNSLLKNSSATSFSIYRNRLLGIPMTFSTICTNE